MSDLRDEAPLGSETADYVPAAPPTKAPEAAPVAYPDLSPETTPQDFDFGAFLGGVRPTRRGVRLYPHAHLVARMEELADQIDRAPESENVDHLIDAFEAAKAEFHEGVWFVVEKRSSEWIEKFRADLKARLRLKVDQDDPSKDDVMTALLHQLVAQIVTPAGVTVEGLRSLFETNEGELNKLLVAMQMVNQSLAEKASVIGVDFSQRRSTNRAQSRTSGR